MSNLLIEQLKGGLTQGFQQPLLTALGTSFETSQSIGFFSEALNEGYALRGVLHSPEEGCYCDDDEAEGTLIYFDNYWLEFMREPMSSFNARLERKIEFLGNLSDVVNDYKDELFDVIKYHQELQGYINSHLKNDSWLKRGVLVGTASLEASSRMASDSIGTDSNDHITAQKLLAQSFHLLVAPPNIEVKSGFSLADQLNSWLVHGNALSTGQKLET